ncbi:transposase [Streptomyces sp. NPDC058676]|uniref:transposase n=1 Tax=unclassified Streptomyces TaxID=2593676 RepID=UPI0036499CDB
MPGRYGDRAGSPITRPPSRYRIARKGIESSTRLGRHRWTIERTMSWLGGCRRLHRRYERKAEHFLAFTAIACSLICYRRLSK